MRTSLDMIADRAGFSVTTVSRVLSGRAQVKPETSDKIKRIARELDYRPNLLVKGLQTGRTGTFGVLGAFADPYYSRLFVGIHDALTERGCVPVLQLTGKTPDGSAIGIPEITQIHAMVDRCVDGIIMLPVEETFGRKEYEKIFKRHIPLVFVDREIEGMDVDFVGTDDLRIGRLAADGLWRAGCRRLAHIAGPDFVSTARLRRRGFVERADELGLAVQVEEDQTFSNHGDRAMARILERLPDVDGVFAANDYLAARAVGHLQNHGRRVPEDVSVIGCGNLEIGEWSRPSLSTVDQHPRAIGRRAVECLFDRLDGDRDRAIRKIHLEPELIARESHIDHP